VNHVARPMVPDNAVPGARVLNTAPYFLTFRCSDFVANGPRQRRQPSCRRLIRDIGGYRGGLHEMRLDAAYMLIVCRRLITSKTVRGWASSR
jgi:hypothetical protein